MSEAEAKESEALRVAQEVRRWARWATNQEMQRVLLAAADLIEAEAKT